MREGESAAASTDPRTTASSRFARVQFSWLWLQQGPAEDASNLRYGKGLKYSSMHYLGK